MHSISPEQRKPAQQLLDFIDASPSPWHAVDAMVERLIAAGFCRLDEKNRWLLESGGRYFAVRGGSSLVAFVVGQGSIAEHGLRMAGAHTDSPGLRIKPRPSLAAEGLWRLAVEVYGGPILATFADRDLTMAGRVGVRAAQGVDMRLLNFRRAMLRLPNLAIHMNREVNDQGLKLHKQNELPLMLSAGAGAGDDAAFRHLLAAALEVSDDDVLSWDLAVVDAQSATFWGAKDEFLAAGRLDNLASCHAALSALLATGETLPTCLCAFFDHEEVGSESAVGAASSFLGDIIDRLAGNFGLDADDRRRMLAHSFLVSADMAHAYNPNFANAYEPGHHVLINGGPVIKSNCNQRYSTNAETAARFALCCERAGVPVQHYAHRTDLGCGSTIGPILAARLGIASVDVGSPMWAMHSARESAGVLDHAWMIAALGAAFA